MKSKSSTKKLNLSATTEFKKIHFVITSGIKIYPIYKNGKFHIQVDNNNRIKTFEKQLTQREINYALAKTIDFYYDQLKQKENGINKGNNN